MTENSKPACSALTRSLTSWSGADCSHIIVYPKAVTRAVYPARGVPKPRGFGHGFRPAELVVSLAGTLPCLCAGAHLTVVVSMRLDAHISGSGDSEHNRSTAIPGGAPTPKPGSVQDPPKWSQPTQVEPPRAAIRRTNVPSRPAKVEQPK